jgi:hypothetical protein
MKKLILLLALFVSFSSLVQDTYLQVGNEPL